MNALIVCERVIDTAAPARFRQDACKKCGADVWVSPEAERTAVGFNPIIYCSHCAGLQGYMAAKRDFSRGDV